MSLSPAYAIQLNKGLLRPAKTAEARGQPRPVLLLSLFRHFVSHFGLVARHGDGQVSIHCAALLAVQLVISPQCGCYNPITRSLA